MASIKRIFAAVILLVVIVILVTTLTSANTHKVAYDIRNKHGNPGDKSTSNQASSSPGSAIVYSVTPYITEYQLPNGTSPNAILVEKDGMVLTVGSAGTLIELYPKTGQFVSYQIPNEAGVADRMSWSMVEDRDGFIWFSQFGPDNLWRFDPSTGKFELFHTSAAPFQMKAENATGDIWFTTLSGDSLGVVQKIENNTESGDNSYKISEFPTGNGTSPSGLTLRGDSVWVTELEKGKVARFDVIRDDSGLVVGIKKMLEIPESIQLATPTDLLFSSNKTLWITEHGTSTVTKFRTSLQNFTRFATSQNSYGVASLPFWLRSSPDNQGLWFNEHEGGNVGFFNFTDATLTEFKVPTNLQEVVYMLNLATDPNDPDKVWFSEWNVNMIGVVNKGLSVPFDIKSNLGSAVLSSSNLHQEIDVEISRTGVLTGTNYTTVNLNASSSMEPAAGFVNMSATFPEGYTFNLSDTSRQNFKLLLEDHSAPPGNYTLGISATNGIVTKTIFLDLVVRS